MKHDKDRYEARCFLAEEYFISLKRMKPLNEREIYRRYMSGEQIPAHDFNDGGLDIYADYVFPEVLKEHATRQLDFDGEVWYTKTRPIELKSNEEHHLSRPTESKNGVTQYFSVNDRTNPLTDEQKLAICRAELATYGARNSR